jgi:ComF family protein
MALDLLRYVGPYAGVLRAQVLFLKKKPYVCPRLREEIRKTVAGEPAFRDVQLVLPIPLHPRRRRERGYNQAELVAEEVARALARPLRREVVRRVIYTEPHRAGADAVARARSVARCFAVASPDALRGRVVLLVDDVYTTGATLNECAQTVRQAGARAVYGFVVARA